MTADGCSMQDSTPEHAGASRDLLHPSLSQNAAIGVLQQQFPAYSQVATQRSLAVVS